MVTNVAKQRAEIEELRAWLRTHVDLPGIAFTVGTVGGIPAVRATWDGVSCERIFLGWQEEDQATLLVLMLLRTLLEQRDDA